MVWIVGEYGHRIDNAVDLMLHFSENFIDESKDVQMAILTASVKLYLRLEDDAEDLVTKVLKLATDDSDNPDLRNRGYIYWRMLSSDPEAAKQIILCEKPPITEDEGNLDLKVRETLLCNLSMLSSVYYKTPEQFVKRIRERLNERMDLDNEGELATAEEYLDSTGVKRSEYLKNAEQNNVGIDYGSYFEGKNVIDLLDIGSS
jgi:AP-1 complex subunit beta-1